MKRAKPNKAIFAQRLEKVKIANKKPWTAAQLLASSSPVRCRICGCTYEHGCPAGCCWIEPDLCSVCWKLRCAFADFVRDARRASAAGVLRLFREVSR